MRHCIHHSPMIVAVGVLDPLPRSDNPLQATYTLGRCQTSMMCCQKVRPDFGHQILKKFLPWTKSRCQCTIMVWGALLTNDCCSRLIGSITKVWQPFTSYIHTGTIPDINDVWSKMYGSQNFCHNLKFSLSQERIPVQHLAMRHCIHQWLLQ